MQQFVETRGELTPEELVELEVFKNAYIPRTLADVIDYERHIIKGKKGQTEGVVCIPSQV